VPKVSKNSADKIPETKMIFQRRFHGLFGQISTWQKVGLSHLAGKYEMRRFEQLWIPSPAQGAGAICLGGFSIPLVDVTIHDTTG
jgi:hypothetical protein